MHLHYVTLTGADDNTSIDDLERISCLYPKVEWAILYSPTRFGVPRYPTYETLLAFIDPTATGLSNLAVHLCGKAVDMAFAASSYEVNTILTHLNDRPHGGRVQLNFHQRPNVPVYQTVEALLRLTNTYPGIKFILQSNPANALLVGMALLFTNCQVIHDMSGGKGIEATDWPKPPRNQSYINNPVPFGYAGGLGPHNIATQFRKIIDVIDHDHPCWIDMESSLRGMHDGIDVFDTDKCVSVLEQVYEILRMSGHNTMASVLYARDYVPQILDDKP